jgi:hypothetical protein
MTTTTSHSPAPWSVEPLQWDHGASIAIVSGGSVLCVIPPRNEDEEPDYHSAVRAPSDEANARLIAAAPELLAALETVLAAFDVMAADTEATTILADAFGEQHANAAIEWRASACAAIASAKGGAQ